VGLAIAMLPFTIGTNSEKFHFRDTKTLQTIHDIVTTDVALQHSMLV
jgi:hypothetical protein